MVRWISAQHKRVALHDSRNVFRTAIGLPVWHAEQALGSWQPPLKKAAFWRNAWPGGAHVVQAMKENCELAGRAVHGRDQQTSYDLGRCPAAGYRSRFFPEVKKITTRVGRARAGGPRLHECALG